MAGASTRARSRTAIVAAAAAVVGALVLGWLALSPLLRRSLESSKSDGPTNRAMLEPAPGSPLSAKPGTKKRAPSELASPVAAVETTLIARDVAGKPCAGVYVDVLDDRGEWEAAPVVASGTTGNDGHLVVRTPPGPLRVRSRHPRFRSVAEQFTAPSEKPVVLAMEDGIPFRVLVTDTEGKPIEGAVVTQREFGQGLPTITGADGVADLGGVDGLWESVVVTKAGYLEQFQWTESAWKRDGRLTVRLVRAAPLTVRVVREGDFAPEPRADVWVSHGHGDARGRADEGGVIRFEAGVAPPGVLVRATTPDDRHGETPIEASPDRNDPSPREVRVVVSSGRSVRGLVVRPDGRPVAGAVLFRANDEDAWIEAGRTDAEGRFAFDHVAGTPGYPVQVRVRADGWAGPDDAAKAPPPSRAPGTPLPPPGAKADEDGTTEPEDPRPAEVLDQSIVVVVSPTCAVVGRVVSKDGKPVVGAKVEVSTPSNAPLALRPLVATTDADGRYRIEDVPPWDHLVVIAEADGLGVQETDEFLPDTKEAALPDVVMPGVFTLDVPVVDEVGRPVPTAWLIISQRVRTRGHMQWHRTVTDGRFHPLEGLSRDGVSIELTAPGFLKDQLRADAATERIVVDRAHTVRGRLVRQRDGTPLPAGLDVSLDAKDKLCTLEGNCARAKTQEGGRFEATGIRTGRYAVSVHEGDTYLPGLLAFAQDGQDVGDVSVGSPAK